MTEPFLTTSGQLAYRKYVPNRVALGIPMTAKGEGDWVSLPFLSILSEAGAALSPANRAEP
ncbi:hypothetical protein [Mesorhizobium wenxiniae]|uniref:Uncharacterized protein n=1 Tax=Mesorhizobium wenxiniae TaxID=2014805 RepID=A0A271KFS1_9HYPH|nr:hypothetical protein [Mesorhizobium wenxiniae]PAP94007.1 hypothetical protein CIT31_16710 [Mesorhizobium wenxiniae]